MMIYISPMKALNFILQNHPDSFNLSLSCHDIVYKLVVAGCLFHVKKRIILSAQFIHTYRMRCMHGFTSSEISCTVMFCIYVCMWLLDIYLSTSVWNMCVMSLINFRNWVATDHVRIFFFGV